MDAIASAFDMLQLRRLRARYSRKVSATRGPAGRAVAATRGAGDGGALTSIRPIFTSTAGKGVARSRRITVAGIAVASGGRTRGSGCGADAGLSIAGAAGSTSARPAAWGAALISVSTCRITVVA